MANKIYVADKATLDQTKANTDAILAAVGGSDNPMAGVKRYGIKINKLDSNPETRVTYILDAEGFTPARMNFTAGTFDVGSWGDIWFIRDNYPVMCKYDGTEDFKLSKTDHTKKEDGTTASGIADTTYAGNAMSAMPKVWMSQYNIGNYDYIVVCEQQYDATFYADPCVRADGTMADKWYLPMFKGASDGTRLRSIAGMQPVASKTAAQEIALAEANGAKWSTKSWSAVNMLSCLIALITKSDNGQTALGNGCLNYKSAEPPYYGVQVTGTATDKGQFFGANDNTHTVKAFYCEDVWANQWDRLRGLILKNGHTLVKMTPPYNLTGDGYTDVGITWLATDGGYIKDSKMCRYGRIPITRGGSASTYQCDYTRQDITVTAVALFGGSVHYGSICGPWCLYLNYSAGVAVWSIGASLSLEQPAA